MKIIIAGGSCSDRQHLYPTVRRKVRKALYGKIVIMKFNGSHNTHLRGDFQGDTYYSDSQWIGNTPNEKVLHTRFTAL